MKTLDRGPNHGFGITLHIQEASGGLLDVEEGSLYPALHRLEKNAWLKAEWRVTENARRARYYSLTPAGKSRLQEIESSWSDLHRGMSRFLRTA